MFDDKILQKTFGLILTKFGPFDEIKPAKEKDYFMQLAESIVSQQLSSKVAPTIIKRVKKTVGPKFTPEKVLAQSHETLRGAGLSNAKAKYLKNTAQAWVDKTSVPAKLTKMSDEEVIENLVQIKGVGQWTAEMFLIFTLGRPDVFSVGDYGLKQALYKLYKIPEGSKPEEYLYLAERWQPNRSLASRVLWKSLEL